MIAALYVATGGSYFGTPWTVDPWDEARDARLYAGPWPVVAHPPCQRWGRFWHGSTRKPHQYSLGADSGCFAAALGAVRQWGGVLEHPRDSQAWSHFGLNKPPRAGGWVRADDEGGWTCCVDQGFYGHFSNKPTWLYVKGVQLPELEWGESEACLDPAIVARMGLERAKRLGEVGGRGGGKNSAPRIGTPKPFRDLLVRIASTKEFWPWA